MIFDNLVILTLDELSQLVNIIIIIFFFIDLGDLVEIWLTLLCWSFFAFLYWCS